MSARRVMNLEGLLSSVRGGDLDLICACGLYYSVLCEL